MKKLFITIITILLPMLAMGQTLLYENDFTGITAFDGWSLFGDEQTDGKVDVDADGVAITVGIQTGQLWQPEIMVVPEGSFDLEEDGDYKVIVTAKFPSDGTLQINMGTWSANDQAQFPVTATGDFQEVVCDFPGWSVDADGAHLLFQVGDFKGTTILKKIQVIDLDGATELLYNYIDKGKIAEVIRPALGKYRGEINIPEIVTHDGVEYTVKKIAVNAFEACNKLTSITIPNSVTSIGENAFQGCSGMSSVNISDIEAWCGISFSYEQSNPLYYAHHLYLNGEEITELTIPNSVSSIGNYAFCGCTGLTSVSIPNSVSSIGSYAFYGCTGLTSVSIPNNVSTIGDGLFSGCTGLTSITIPQSVSSIANSAFSGCSSLKSITIPNSVNTIGSSAFSGCSGLTSITFPNSVSSIGSHAFQNCTGLTSIKIPNCVSYINGEAFRNCTGLTSVTIGSGVNSIGWYAFANCPNLNDVYCLAEILSSNDWSGEGLWTDTDAFSDSYIDYTTLHVPTASLNDYKNTVPWSGFGTFEALSGETVQKCATPTISFEDGKVKFSCETEGVEYVSELSTEDVGNRYTDELSLSGKIIVKVYATKSGYLNSDTATAEFSATGVFGDLNGDGKVNVADHVKLSSIIMDQNE